MSQSWSGSLLGNVSLFGGWLYLSVQFLALAALVTSTGWRDRSWRLLKLPLATAVAALAALTLAVLAGESDLAGEPIPLRVWAWVAVAFFGVAVLIAGWRSARWWHRASGVAGVLLALLSIGLVLNQWVGYLPTIYAAWANITDAPVHHQVALSKLHTMRQIPETGEVVPVHIPDTISHFPHRTEYVYLPPVWFHGPGHPELPVLEMIGPQFHKPADWIRTGGAAKTADAYAARHRGDAPILVFTDADGSFRKDTECVDGIRGNAASHLAEDIPPYIEQTFGASPDPRMWGVVGWSMGGTCAVTLAVTHPGVFDTFEDISGDLGPNMGGKAATIESLYGGNVALWAANDPLTVLAHRHWYPWSAGWFEDATKDGKHDKAVRFAHELSLAARRDGIATTVVVHHGSHNWQFGARAFADALPWLMTHLSTAGPLPQPTQHAAPGEPVATGWHPIRG
jgi:hypothetical protein